MFGAFDCSQIRHRALDTIGMQSTRDHTESRQAQTHLSRQWTSLVVLMAQSSFLGDGKAKRESLGSVRLTRAEVAKHCTAGDCWVIVNDRVYDPTIVKGTRCLLACLAF